jgi:hypothetical protein
MPSRPPNLLEQSVAAQKEASAARAMAALREQADKRRFWGEVDAATKQMASDNPGTMPRYYGEMGPLTKLMPQQPQGITGPAGMTFYNRKMIEQDKVPVAGIVRHEMTHVGQGPWAWLKSAVDVYEREAQMAEHVPTPEERANTPAPGLPPVPHPPMFRRK